MSKYTTEVRYICEVNSGLNESVGYSKIEDVITGAIPKIFDFDFPIFDESYRIVLERKILKHFYTREICEETAGLWKLRLDTRLNEIMPYYNKLYESELIKFDPLYSDNLTRTRKTDFDSSRKTSNNGKTTSKSNTQGSGNGSDLYSDTPQGSIVGLDENTYLTNARKTTDNSSTTTTSSNNSSGTIDSSDNGSDNLKSTEEYLESVSGWSGVTGSELIMKYRETFINIDVMILNELEDLFFQLW